MSPKEVFMLFGGIQKLTLLDFPGKVACTVFTYGCNFRCPFCHNSPLVTGGIEYAGLSCEEVLSFLKKRQGTLDGICITGGEPTLQPDLFDFMRKAKDLGYAVKLDTNGYRPDILKSAVNEGLVDYVAMDIKNCCEKYQKTAGLFDLDVNKIRESCDFLMSGRCDFEFRTTVARELHTEYDMERIGRWLMGFEKYFLQPYRENENVLTKGLTTPSKDEMKLYLASLCAYIPNACIRSE